jgi:hypothetical protein
MKFVNEPTVTYKTVRTHGLLNKLRLHRIGNSNSTQLPWSIGERVEAQVR